MTTSDLAALTAIARKAAQRAAHLLSSSSDKDRGEVRSKTNHRDLVTEWDTRLEQLICDILFQETPEIPILGEETGQSATSSSSGDWWMIDPIDGTYNFAHGLPFYAISIGLERRGEPVIGVVHAPALGLEFHGFRDGGAFEGEHPMEVSQVGELKHALLATGFPPDRAENSHNFAEWEHLQRIAGGCRRLGAASLDLAMVARGWLDGYWETRLSPWDLCAGSVLVREANGVVTDITGGHFRVRSGNAIASNNAIHKELLDELTTQDGVIHEPGKDQPKAESQRQR